MANVWAGIYANRYIKQKAPTHSYEQAAAFLGDAHRRTVACNIDVERLSATSVGIRLYRTLIIIYHADGTFEADDGGWRTVTTTTRMQQFGPEGWWYHHRNQKFGAAQLRGSRGGHYESVAMGGGVRHPIEPQVRKVFRPSTRYDQSDDSKAIAEQYRGRTFQILREIQQEEQVMYLVRFDSGFELECYAEEVFQ